MFTLKLGKMKLFLLAYFFNWVGPTANLQDCLTNFPTKSCSLVFVFIVTTLLPAQVQCQHQLFSLGIQSPCQRMIGVYNHLLNKVFRFHYHSHKVIGPLGFYILENKMCDFFPGVKIKPSTIGKDVFQPSFSGAKCQYFGVVLSRKSKGHPINKA